MAGKLMHALQYDSYGGGTAGLKLLHVQVPVPSPKRNEVLLKLEAISINPIDWKIQKGMIRPFLPRKFPFIPATDVAGEVVEVGSGVKNLKAGDKVVGIVSYLTGGGLAEYVVVSPNVTIKRPQEVGADEAAALPVPAASGGVGHYAVQLAKLGNAHVTATCGARNIDFVKSLGADEVLDYKTPEGATLKSPSGKKYDVVIHCANSIPFSTFEPNLSKNGKVIDITPRPSAIWTYAVKKLTMSKKQFVPLFLIQKLAENLKYLVNLVKEGKVKTVIDSKYSLSKAEDAWAKSIDGHAAGKIIVEP
ncbi:Polyketide synthase enoylreductase domain [Arabidopsis thaliana x Arabidopsis arenosa]|uniref:Polyketide synthase enoylreductase domain n=1 Tax=Arabidopsis thaliana x Arabidopsis arenosa TaxID=1240361 RepID=A0A8T1YCY7_9BRAS|nr:Polyketide synthase enoylreductase domain [Arabidopsis thaliana x Arabidopsis arenosa]